jgi:selenoprotein W-related protein
VSAISDLMTDYQHVISNLRVITGGKGVFDVVVNGDVLYSKADTGRHAEPGEVLKLFKEMVGPEVEPYPRS